MEKDKKISVEHLNLYYGTNHALKDVNMGISELAVKKMKALNKALYDNNLSEAFFIGGGYFRNVADNDFGAVGV